MARVEVIYSPAPRHIDRVELTLPEGATVGQALRESGLLERHGLAIDSVQVGVWCKRQALDTPLRDRDRIEIYRPLKVDPKEARRQRYKQHLAKTAGKR